MGMTSEDKIHALKLIKLKIEPPTDNRLGWLETWIHKEDLEAFDSAIKALEQEPRKGHWITKPHVYGATYCSECDFELKIDDTNFCPNCGSDMREVAEE